jgi:polyphenol oxidase
MSASGRSARASSAWRIAVSSVVAHEAVPELSDLGFHAFTTTREAGSFNVMSPEPAADVMARWYGLVDYVGRWAPRFATARQVHGAVVHRHDGGWAGWLRAPEGDGHFAASPGTAMAVTVADCVPVFLAHPAGAAAMIHAGWRGTAAGILGQGIACFREAGLEPEDLALHLGPSICGTCYEVGPDVYQELTGRSVDRPTCADLRALLASQAAALGVRRISTSPWCTRCHNDRFFSHRCGDRGRQLGVIVATG